MRITLTVLLLLITCCSVAQTWPLATSSPPKDWKRIYVKNIGSIDIPPIMEVQAGQYKEFVDERNKIRGYDTHRIVIQQRGLNDIEDKSLQKYARVIIETEVGSPGDYERLNFNISDISREDIKALNSQFKNQLIAEFNGTPLKLVEWYDLKVEKVNGMSCLHINFKRQGAYKTDVLVNMYIFQNHDRLHRLTLSYRLSEQGYWQPHFPSILSSFRITNVK